MLEHENNYYAVCLSDTSGDKDTPSAELIFTNRIDALNLVKLHKGSRFKAFADYADALNFSKSSSECPKTESANLPKEPESLFKSPTSPDLAIFRKYIETGDTDKVSQLIWSNPKYLISNADTPVLLMSGPRYNGAHIAAKSNKHEILKLILDSINNTNLFKLLYPQDSYETILRRIDYLLDLYLNTPDKGFLEMPLHFASKFGAAECVELLLSYSMCDSNRLNKFGKKAEDMICSRQGDSLKALQIRQIFEDRFYIPVFRKSEGIEIGIPSKSIPKNEQLQGIAGPMSPKQANNLYKTLKSPRLSGNVEDLKIRLTDPDKGVERVARKLCQDGGIKWLEYWPFIDTHINLSSKNGLDILENHLKKFYEEIRIKENNILHSRKENEIKMRNLCLEFENLSTIDLNTTKEGEGDSEEDFFTAPSTPIFEYEFFVNGMDITKWDKLAFVALQNCVIDEIVYPHISNWYKRVQLANQNFNESLSFTIYSDDTTPKKRIPIKHLLKSV